MAITFARVDDRVIHGQTIMRWGAEKPCSAIIVISDSVAEDELRKKVLRAAAGHLKLGIYDVQQGVSACEKARESKRDFFVISDSIEAFAKLRELGGDFGPTLNVGNLTVKRPDIKNLGDAVCLNDEDVAAVDSLEANGVEVQFQLVPNSGVRTWQQVKAKYQSM